ncbi:auxin-responsive protein IAA31 [Punica granatum]|uniref:Auxin-responsive protein n=2 Tax=Punica granatum TaxID=22663 RepID=A0A218W488_PUNGR|nr:auxin-responsive protein IAA31 [Punica granatum]OWM67363.1 hypothetical protein CDL15_Pgr000815 [Punica granatum]PKI43055.1 hypothetical protein CRG98_036534 [Punica granatum]
MGRSSSSPSSSIDSTSNLTPLSPSSPNSSSSSSSICLSSNFTSRTTRRSIRRDLSTDLRLGLSISSSPKHVLPNNNVVSIQRVDNQQRPDWPPIKPLLRSALSGRSAEERHGAASSLFVKVYMEGVPIGRKLDLLNHDGYANLAETLAHMFKAPILCPNGSRAHSDKHYVLTYEDREGDWMMVGDVPWEIFMSTVKRLKITRADRC